MKIDIVRKKDKENNRTVRIVAVNKKYRDRPFFAAPKLKDGIYLTGQHKGCGLSSAELAADKSVLTIDEKKQYPVMHYQSFDLSNDRDRIMFNFLLFVDEIAHSSKLVRPSKHLFYIEDKERESVEDIKFNDLMFEAMEKIRNEKLDSLIDVAIYVLESGDPKKMSKTILTKRLYDICKTNPERILEYYKGGNEDLLFVKKLINYGILQKRLDGIYDDSTYLGKIEKDVVIFLRDKKHNTYKTRWGFELEKAIKKEE